MHVYSLYCYIVRQENHGNGCSLQHVDSGAIIYFVILLRIILNYFTGIVILQDVQWH